MRAGSEMIKEIGMIGQRPGDANREITSIAPLAQECAASTSLNAKGGW